MSTTDLGATHTLCNCRLNVTCHVWPVEVAPKRSVRSLVTGLFRDRKIITQVQYSSSQWIGCHNLYPLIEACILYEYTATVRVELRLQPSNAYCCSARVWIGRLLKNNIDFARRRVIWKVLCRFVWNLVVLGHIFFDEAKWFLTSASIASMDWSSSRIVRSSPLVG